MTSESAPNERVGWINVIPLNRREKIARWWVESVRQQQTYSSRRQREQESMTHIGVDQIDAIASDGLREALYRQKKERESGASSVTYPRATPDGSVYLGAISIPSKPLGIEFTVHGVIPSDDEDH